MRRNQNRDGPGRTALDTEALTWRILVDPPSSGPQNMAVDHALAACSSPGEAVLRIYRWGCPTVSFGRNEPALDRYDPARGHSAGIEFVRRPTGGRAVLHDRELTYAAVLPCPTPGGLRATYGLINRGLVEALCSLGVPAAMAAGRGLHTGPDAGPCFDEPAPGEVTVAGRKLVGSAQARSRGRYSSMVRCSSARARSGYSLWVRPWVRHLRVHGWATTAECPRTTGVFRCQYPSKKSWAKPLPGTILSRQSSRV